MSSGVVKLSVPISSFGPHLPQFLYFSAASRMSWRVIFRADIDFPLMKPGRRRAGEYSLPERAIASPAGNGRSQCYDTKKYGGTAHALDVTDSGWLRDPRSDDWR